MKKVLRIVGVAILAIVVLWGTEIIPKSIGRHTATKYVQENYNEMGLEFENIVFSTVYGDYIASFFDEDDTVYNFRLFTGQLPISVVYDSIKQSKETVFTKFMVPQEDTTDFVTPEEIFMIPSLTTVDISAYYTKGTPFFDESRPKYSLPCQYIADNTYAESEMSYSLPIEQFSTMNFQCTWTRLGNTVYIGFLNAATDVAYVIPCVSGTASGSVEFNCLPDGDYKVILYSNRNFSTTAVLNYQFS